MLSENNPTDLHSASMRAFCGFRDLEAVSARKRKKIWIQAGSGSVPPKLAEYRSATSSGWEQKQTISYVLAESEIV
jgi:hypothetical protein